MDKGKAAVDDNQTVEEEVSETVLCQVECYAYLLPPNNSKRTADWNLDKPFWKGVLKVTSKGDKCIIRLEDETTGELYVQTSYTNQGVEPTDDSNNHFVLRVEAAAKTCEIVSTIAYVGVGFHEIEAFDFRAAREDHKRILYKKKAAEELKQTPHVDYRLKEGETLVVQLKNQKSGGSSTSLNRGSTTSLNIPSSEDKITVTPGMIPRLPPPPGRLPPPLPPPSRKRKWDEADNDFGDFQSDWSPF